MPKIKTPIKSYTLPNNESSKKDGLKMVTDETIAKTVSLLRHLQRGTEESLSRDTTPNTKQE
jgi:hypothetical protein